ncbi:hypothetical protein BH11ARM2_BH11ARM2_21650 [soil metagenome]
MDTHSASPPSRRLRLACLVALGLLAAISTAGPGGGPIGVGGPIPACPVHEPADGGTGCRYDGGGCGTIRPAYGITWTGQWECCPDTTGALTVVHNSHCTWGYNGGCCVISDTTPHCPATPCP